MLSSNYHSLSISVDTSERIVKGKHLKNNINNIHRTLTITLQHENYKATLIVKLKFEECIVIFFLLSINGFQFTKVFREDEVCFFSKYQLINFKLFKR